MDANGPDFSRDWMMVWAWAMRRPLIWRKPRRTAGPCFPQFSFDESAQNREDAETQRRREKEIFESHFSASLCRSLPAAAGVSVVVFSFNNQSQCEILILQGRIVTPCCWESCTIWAEA